MTVAIRVSSDVRTEWDKILKAKPKLKAVDFYNTMLNSPYLAELAWRELQKFPDIKMLLDNIVSYIPTFALRAAKKLMTYPDLDNVSLCRIVRRVPELRKRAWNLLIKKYQDLDDSDFWETLKITLENLSEYFYPIFKVIQNDPCCEDFLKEFLSDGRIKLRIRLLKVLMKYFPKNEYFVLAMRYQELAVEAWTKLSKNKPNPTELADVVIISVTHKAEAWRRLRRRKGEELFKENLVRIIHQGVKDYSTKAANLLLDLNPEISDLFAVAESKEDIKIRLIAGRLLLKKKLSIDQLLRLYGSLSELQLEIFPKIRRRIAKLSQSQYESFLWRTKDEKNKEKIQLRNKNSSQSRLDTLIKRTKNLATA